MSAIFAHRCSGIKYYVGICGSYDLCEIGNSSFPKKEWQIKYGIEGEASQKRASAIYNIRNDPPITLLLHGSEDDVIDPNQAIRFAQALEKKGATVKVELFDGLGHDFFAVTLKEDHRAIDVMTQFLKRVMLNTNIVSGRK